MEVPRFNDHDKKKTLFKISGGDGGGGIGTVILMGGALATAALTSGFILWKNMRKSGNKQPSNKQQQNKQDEAKSHIQKLPRSTTKQKKVGFSDQIIELQDENPNSENSGGKPAGVANNEFIIKNVIHSDEKLPSDPKNMMHEAKNELIKEGFTERISKEGEDFQQVYVDKEPTPNGVKVVDDEMNNDEIVEISEIKSESDENTQEEIVLDVVDKAIEDMMNNHVIDNGDHIAEQMQGEQNLNLEVEKDLKGFGLSDDVNSGEAIGRTEAVGLEFVEKETNNIVSESLVAATAVNDEQEPDEEMLLEYCEANQTEFHNLESSVFEPIDNQVEPKNVENVKEEDIENLVENISEVVKAGDLANEEDSVKDYDSEEEEDSETDLSDESEENSTVTQDSSPLSNSEAIWPAEDSTVELQQIKLLDQELTGKIGEDKAIKQVESVPDDIFQNNSKNVITAVSLMNTVMKNVVENKLVKDHMGSANAWRMIIVMLSILLSLLCSWMFGCSFVKLYLVMFLSLVLSEIHGY